MDISRYSIATMTWARDDDEEQLLRAALTELAKLNIPTFISDGGSNEGFTSFITSFPNFKLLVPQTKGLWPQVQSSVKAAYDSGSDVIIYTEPDKLNFFKSGLPDMLNKLSIDNQSGVVIAVRVPAGFASYPVFQQMCETTINKCCAEVTGIDTDYTYGPFFMNRAVVPYLNGLEASIGWGWRPYAFVITKRLGYNIETFEGEYFCPEDQRADNATDRLYRMKQLYENIEAVVLANAASLIAH